MSPSNPDQVTARLHTLRCEAYRRQRNLQSIRATSSNPSTFRGPSLPHTYINETENQNNNARYNVVSVSSPRKAAGPPPPRSWLPSKISREETQKYRSSSEWRMKALGLIFHHSSTTTSPPTSSTGIPTSFRIPSLLQLTLHVLLFRHDGIPLHLLDLLPPHILREYMRYSALYRPLPRDSTEALWKLGCDGEVIVLGPNNAGSASTALEAMNAILSETSAVDTGTCTVPAEWDAQSLDEEDADWEDTSLDITPALPRSFIALSVTLAPMHLSRLPATLTHLALIDVPRLPIHLLPAQVPLIEALDLSFNPWVGEGIGVRAEMITASTIVGLPPVLHRIEWRKWRELKVLGLRGCGIVTHQASDVEQNEDKELMEVRRRVNKGRLEDVEVVFGE